MKRAFSLIGVLAALLILTTVLMMIFRFNHGVEKWFYRPLESRNQLRFKAWQYAADPETEPENALVTPLTIQGRSCLKVQQEGETYYVFPPETEPGTGKRK